MSDIEYDSYIINETFYYPSFMSTSKDKNKFFI